MIKEEFKITHYLRLVVFLTFLVSLLVTVFVLPRLSRVASRIGLMDFPDSKRKVHKSPKPLVGGIGMGMGILMSSLFFIPLTDLRGVFIGTALLMIIGFLDDFSELDHKIKFLAQIIAAILMMVSSKAMLISFGHLIPGINFEMNIFIAAPLTVFCAVGVMNSINMIDGLDGLAGGVSMVGFISMGILAYFNSQMVIGLLCLALLGAVIGFLIYNWNPSKLFMGDSGSLFLGLMLAFLSIITTQGGLVKSPPVAPLLILGVPIIDTLRLMVKRIKQKRNPFAADKDHIHHILLKKCNNEVKGAVLIIISISAILSIIAIAGTYFKVPEYYMFAVFVIYAILHITILAKPQKT
ncbi:MAG: undecaprenyl/decaprenyl-phosphate alpha-N-acetylglucosaminyl 1-phosphate transferase [Nitrospirae bacterium]|nr:undecaprenyl/decaprenyl-phosphate alpha-N-acetylglucosaminyl 1-phosphate transferase [Nitrospirota bacterium]MBF0540268.1 undecaprenyl/decaprenyl-phosphate alpha-N-acetylglucosaminyl 1-phosphate transferase [Nitrospirota bacterium]